MSPGIRAHVFLIAAVACLFTGALSLSAQQPGSVPSPPADDVVRVQTELIQSPVIVLDKQGNFVSGLSREQFELNIDNQPRPISFFEQITAGTAAEAEKYELARKGSVSTEKPESRANAPSVYGRTVVFFIDDLHLNSEAVNRTRVALLNFIDHSLGQYDRAMVISATGQIGFLQQLTDNKDVLRAAVNRIKHREFTVSDEARPAMTAYQALAVDTGDSRTMQHFADMEVEDTFRRQSSVATTPERERAEKDMREERNRKQAEDKVRNRARNLLRRYSTISASTLSALSQSMVALNQLPGSKLAFFISDGFFLNQQISGELQKLNDITNSAMRSGTVVYSIQASGLSFAFPGANTEVRVSGRGEAGATMLGQDTALQAPLYTVAVDTGGRALFNANSMDGSIKEALGETSKYYLLAWRPDTEEKRPDMFHRVQVRIKDRPELTVRMQKGYFRAPDPKKTASSQPAPKPTPIAEPNETELRAQKMREALSALYPLRDLPTIIEVSFIDQPNAGAVLNIGTELRVGQLPRPTNDEKRLVDLAGVVLNDEGKTVGSFSGQLKINLNATGTPQVQTVSHVDEIKVKPGLYQVRVAARDGHSGVSGSAADWILVPDLSGGKVALSSLLVGDVNATNVATSPDQKARLSINHHFTRAGRLRFFTYIYNAARGLDGKSAPDLTVQLRVMRDNQVLSTSPQIKVPTEGIEDLARIPYAVDIALQKLAPGHYSVSVTASDNVSKSSSTQSVKFVVE